MDEQERINRSNQDNSRDIYYLQEAIAELKQHAKTSNNEVGLINEKMIKVTNDTSWLKSEFYNFVKVINKLDNRTWMILSTTVVGVLGLIVQIILAIYRK